MNLSIKNVPEELVERLKARARRSRRSLTKEVLVILERAVAEEERLTPRGLLAEVRRRSLATGPESAAIVRAARDARAGG